jgi:hypothetical protein
MMNDPSGANFETRFAPRLKLCPSVTKMSPFGATATSVGSFSSAGGSPATPAWPIVSNSSPSGLLL